MYLDKLDGEIEEAFYKRHVSQWREEQDRIQEQIRQQRISLLPVQSPSPNWIIDRTFTLIFFFQPKPQNKEKLIRCYRNPVFIAKEYKRMIEIGEIKNQSDLASKLGVSRVRVSQVLSLLKLDENIKKAVEKLGDPITSRIITERMLRSCIKHPEMCNTLLSRLSG